MLAYSSAGAGSVDIFVAAADGSDATNLTRNAAWDDYPAWSPDGKMMAFSSNREGPFHIYIMNADGSNVRRLTAGDDWNTTPAWSPDGKKIAFASDRSDTFQIYTSRRQRQQPEAVDYVRPAQPLPIMVARRHTHRVPVVPG